MATDLEMLNEENKNIRLLRMSCDFLVQTLMTQPLHLSEAESMIRGLRRLAGELFPGKEHVFDLIYLPRFRRALRAAGYFGESPSLRAIPGKGPAEGSDQVLDPALQ
jgi:hypothetical protein